MSRVRNKHPQSSSAASRDRTLCRSQPTRAGSCDVSRRRFLTCIGAGAIGATTSAWSAPLAVGEPRVSLAGSLVTPAPRYAGRVVEVSTDGVAAGQVRQQVVDQMIERGMRELTGAGTLADAWKLFATPSDVVGLKVNALSGARCASHREVVQAIIKGLGLAGVPERNIIIWDRFESHLRRSDFTIQQRPGSLRCYGTDSPGVGFDPEVFYSADFLKWLPDELKKSQRRVSATYPNSHFSSIFTRDITKQINVPVLKDHSIAGMTLSLKNVAFGICNNTERFHPSPINCDPMIPEVCAHPMIVAKNVLTIADCLTILYEGGPTVDPRYLLDYGSILVGTDMVALDKTGLDLLERIRKEKGLLSLWKTNAPPKHVPTAARMGLGTDNADKIDHRRLTVAAK
jgi:uncharacterized protein (DUF362 family)